MKSKVVREIPANPFLRDARKLKKNLRVAAYCRVSTEEEEQQSSFEIQVEYYTNKIASHDNWTLAGIFADDGISGVHVKNRTQFLEMIELCKKKKIDLILTKSISRFARNTLECIQYVRMLKALGIPVIFEKEGINTADMTSEMLLTCLSSFAQAESESISLNVARGKRMGYKQGKFSFRYTNFLGYRKGADGQPEIVPAQADAIQMMFQSYLNGDSLFKIKEALENKGILTATGKKEWTTQAILRILQNEKYMGDVLLQKTFTANFLEGKPRKNNGELPQYYIENNHPAIVTREVFHRVQEEIARRKSKRPASQKKSKTNRGKFTSQYALSERLVCGTCGCYYRRVTWKIHGRKQIVWRCINRLEFGKRYCGDSPSIPEEALHAAIVKSIQSLLDGRQEELASCLQGTIENYWCDDAATSPLAVQNKLDRLNREFDRLLLLIGDEENVFLEKKFQKINNEILSLKQEVKYTERQNVQNRDRMDKLREVMELLSAENMEITEYSDVLACRLIEQITVLSKTEIRIRFVGGYEVEQKLLI